MRAPGACFAEAADVHPFKIKFESLTRPTPKKALSSCFHPPDIRGRQVRLRRTLGVLIVVGRDKFSYLEHAHVPPSCSPTPLDIFYATIEDSLS